MVGGFVSEKLKAKCNKPKARGADREYPIPDIEKSKSIGSLGV